MVKQRKGPATKSEDTSLILIRTPKVEGECWLPHVVLDHHT